MIFMFQDRHPDGGGACCALCRTGRRLETVIADRNFRSCSLLPSRYGRRLRRSGAQRRERPIFTLTTAARGLPKPPFRRPAQARLLEQGISRFIRAGPVDLVTAPARQITVPISRGQVALSLWRGCAGPAQRVFAIAIQVGLVGGAILLAMWAVHFSMFVGGSFACAPWGKRPLSKACIGSAFQQSPVDRHAGNAVLRGGRVAWRHCAAGAWPQRRWLKIRRAG